MKYRATIFLILSTIAGFLLGYLLKDYLSKENLFSEKGIESFLGNSGNFQAFSKYFSLSRKGGHEPYGITENQAEDYIKGLYDTLGKDEKFINNTIKTSYIYNLSPLLSVAYKRKIDPSLVQMRIYPAKKPKTDSTETEFTMVIALEYKDELFKGNYEQFEFIAPCPFNCPTNNDYFRENEWIQIYRGSLKRELKFK
ncbi:MAG: hypothetical protein LCH67_18660 [Bacteroidetes bacterium]|nr:hypothetical protein [Bacteroidota bacterium]